MSSTTNGVAASDGGEIVVPSKAKGGAMYHCDYCRADITNAVHIRCAECHDFDLCLDCFLKGIQLQTHMPTHSYRVIEHVRTAIFDVDWGADDELLILEAIDTYGFGNWADIAEHVGAKNKTQCESHYTAVYLRSPTRPLPCKLPSLASDAVPISADVVSVSLTAVPPSADVIMSDATASSDPTIPASADVSGSSTGKSKNKKKAGAAASLVAANGASNTKKTSAAVSASFVSSTVGGVAARPRPKSGLGHLVGYIPARGDFDVEYDNDAELILADMEFKDEDSQWERELKLKVIEVYNSKLDARIERKRFILERGLLERKEKKRSREEKEIYNNMRCFARFHSAEQHETFVAGLINENRLRKRIEALQLFRLNGCKTLRDADALDREKKKSTDAGATTQTAGNNKRRLTSGDGDVYGAGSISGGGGGGGGGGSYGSSLASANNTFPLDGLNGAELLSDRERALCMALQLLPSHYLHLKEKLIRECSARGFVKDGKASSLVRIDANKTKEIVDFFVSVGFINTVERAAPPPAPSSASSI